MPTVAASRAWPAEVAHDEVAVPRLVEAGGAPWWRRLDDLAQRPSRLWVAGTEEPRHPAVAVVGSRRASIDAKAVARRIGHDAAAAGFQVVSGMAAGVDAAAHEGALEAGGTTVAVLGCGIDVCYPAAHTDLRVRILRSGCLVSEDPPGTPPAAWRFPRRNRLIAALAVAVVVVEAGERSGALSTARHAADLGRDVFAAPSSIRTDVALGSNRLLRDGATPYLCVDDLLASLPGLGTRDRATAPAPRGGDLPAAADAVDRRLLGLLRGGPAHPDDLGAELGLPSRELSRRLTCLELAGRLSSFPSGLVGLPGS